MDKSSENSRNRSLANRSNWWRGDEQQEEKMQPNQVKENFGAIDQRIVKAAQLCQARTDIPAQLRESVSELRRESDQAMQMLASEKNEDRIVQCVDRLEKLGDRALHVCAQAGTTVDQQIQAAVKEAHDALSDLKHSLH
jgi:hypothetical protein